MDQISDHINIFDHQSFSSYFSAYIEMQRRTKRSFSYRSLCRITGIKSPAMITWIAKGERLPSAKVLEKLNEVIGWRGDEYAYAFAMISFEKAENFYEKEFFRQKMQEMLPIKGQQSVDKDASELFRKWYIPAILEMVHLEDFQNNPKWIAARLGGKVSEDEVKVVLETLEALKFLVKDERGAYTRPYKSLRSLDNVPVAVVRRWHTEMMKIASRAIHMQDHSERYFSGITMTVRKDKMKEAQSLLTEFRERFTQLVQCDPGDETYHFSIQYYRLTEPAQE